MSVVLQTMMDHPTALPGNNWTNTTTLNCVGINLLPFHGNEILGLCIIYLAIVALYCVTFVDVALKQAWPEKFLDAEVMKRVQKLQSDFPGIVNGAGSMLKFITASDSKKKNKKSEEATALVDTNGFDLAVKAPKAIQAGEVAEIQYDQIVSQEPYIATCCVDEDITFQLANGRAYGTVSEYCSSTVRGYAMLSVFLPVTSTTLGFLWAHNAMIDPIGDNYARWGRLVGYFLAFVTGTIMCGPASNSVHRNRNIILWDSIPTSSKLIHYHTTAIILFCLIPMLCNLYLVITTPKELMLNATAIWIGISAQLVGLAVFEAPVILKYLKHPVTQLQGDKIEIIGEILVVMASMLTFIQIETFSTAACAQMPTTYGAAIVATILAVLVTLCVKTYAGAPLGPYANDPSVLLLNNGQPVAVSGPIPLLNYNRDTAFLPSVQPATSDDDEDEEDE